MKTGNLFAVGCALQSGVLITGFVVSYLLAGYSLNYWGSQYKGCPTTFGVLPKVGLTIITPGMIVPAALVTAILDGVKDDDVLPGPRAKKMGLELCN
jgi:hypothetical protein